MGVVYAFIYFTTDQYVPSLPQMEASARIRGLRRLRV